MYWERRGYLKNIDNLFQVSYSVSIIKSNIYKDIKMTQYKTDHEYLHGVSLAKILEFLIDTYDFE